MDAQVAKTVATFFDQYPVRSYKKGQILIHAGDDPDAVMHLISGRVKEYDLTYRGDEVILNVFKPPAFFPMSYAINGTPNRYFFEVEEDVELHRAPIDDVVRFVKADPDVLYNLLARVYRGTDGVLERVAHLMASTARSRVMYEVIIACRRFGVPKGAGYEIDLNETDIGARAGLSRETVSREMAKLKAGNLIQLGKKITVPDLALLESSLGHDL